jgi:hypothetical protein
MLLSEQLKMIEDMHDNTKILDTKNDECIEHKLLNTWAYEFIKSLKTGTIIKFIKKSDSRRHAEFIQQGQVKKIYRDKFVLSVKSSNDRFITEFITVNMLIAGDWREYDDNKQ